MGKTNRSGLEQWFRHVEELSPDRSRRRRWRRTRDEPRLREWCTEAPREALFVLADEAALRTETSRLEEDERNARKQAESMRRKLRRRLQPFPAASADLKQVLNDPGLQAPAARIQQFVAGLNTVDQQGHKAKTLAKALGEECGSELLDALRAAEADPPKAGHLRVGMGLASRVVELEQQEQAAQTTIEQMPEQLARRLNDQSEAILRLEGKIAKIDEEIDAVRDQRLKVAANREQAELRGSQINDDLDRLDATFDVLLAHARSDPAVDADALYESYRECTDRERVWLERARAEAQARDLQNSLHGLQRRYEHLQQSLEECNEDRSQLSDLDHELRAKIRELWDRINELEVENRYLESSLDVARDDNDRYRSRAVGIDKLGFTPGLEQALMRAGIYNLGQLADAFPDDVAQIPSIGDARRQRIAQVLAEWGQN